MKPLFTGFFCPNDCDRRPPMDDTEDKPVAILEYGDSSWHDGDGWYYYDDEYRDEGSCGAFTFKQDAIAHAESAGYRVVERTTDEVTP